MSVKGFGVAVSTRNEEDEEREMALHRWDMVDPSIEVINEFSKNDDTSTTTSLAARKKSSTSEMRHPAVHHFSSCTQDSKSPSSPEAISGCESSPSEWPLPITMAEFEHRKR
jgi:hypothetical protein